MSVKPESAKHLGEASLQPGLSVKEDEAELSIVAISPRRQSTLELEIDVTPNNDETAVEKVFRLLGDQILELAILDGPVGSSSPSRELALRYRLVCRDWRDTINSIYRTAAIPLFQYEEPFYEVSLVGVKRITGNLKSLSSLFGSPVESGACPAVVSPVSLGFSLACCSRIPWETKIELKATALNTLRQLGCMLLTLKLELSNNSREGMSCSSLDLPNLLHAEFIFCHRNHGSTNATLGSWKIVKDIVEAATSLQTLIIINRFVGVTVEMPKLVIPKSMEKLELHYIRIPMWLIDIAPTLKNMQQLVFSMWKERLSGPKPVGHKENLLINKLSKYLDYLKLENILPAEPKSAISILEPMPKLRTLSFRSWKLGQLMNYKELLPSLTDLDVVAYSDTGDHFPASWYSSPSSTLRRLRLGIHGRHSEASLFSQQVLGGIARSFPNLYELDVSSDNYADDNWQPILIQGFLNLRKLKIVWFSVSAEGRNRLVAAVSGIPLEELQVILEGEKELAQVMNDYQHCLSLRDLKFLEELQLHAYRYEQDDEDRHVLETNSSVMVYSTFLRMPNLKKVVLSRMFRLTDELQQHARDETGLYIRLERH